MAGSGSNLASQNLGGDQKMDKAKTNFVIIISVLAIVSLFLIGYAASLSVQLGAEKTKAMQLNDQITGLKDKVNDSEAQLASVTANTAGQADLVNSLRASVKSLQSSLDTANAESAKLKTEYANLEAKLKAEVPVNTPEPAASEAVPANQ